MTTLESTSDESASKRSSLPASPSGSLQFARPPRPRSRGSTSSSRRNSLAGVFSSQGDQLGGEPTTAGLQRSASYTPSFSAAADHANIPTDDAAMGAPHLTRSASYNVELRTDTHRVHADLAAFSTSAARALAPDAGVEDELSAMHESLASDLGVTGVASTLSPAPEIAENSGIASQAAVSRLGESAKNSMVAPVSATPAAPAVASASAMAAEDVDDDAASEDTASIDVVPAGTGMLSVERVRDSVILQAEKSPQLLALRDLDDDDELDTLTRLTGESLDDDHSSGDNSGSEDDIASFQLPGVLNPAQLVVDEAQPPKSPLLGNVDDDDGDDDDTDTLEGDVLGVAAHIIVDPDLSSASPSLSTSEDNSAGECAQELAITGAVASPALTPSIGEAAHGANGEAAALDKEAHSDTGLQLPALLPLSPLSVDTPQVLVTAQQSTPVPMPLPTIAATMVEEIPQKSAGSANGERQILIARLCSLGHSEAAANDALDANPNASFDQLLVWLSHRRLAVLKSDAREEQRLRRQMEAEFGAPIIYPPHIVPIGMSARLSDTGSDDSALLPDVRLVDRTRARDPMHRPPDPRSITRPRPILKTQPGRSKDGKDGRDGKDGSGSSLWQRSRGWFSLPARLASGSGSVPQRKENPYHHRQSSSLRYKHSPYSRISGPPSPSPSSESDELPTRQLKQVRFPVHGMAIKYLYNADRPIQPGLRMVDDSEAPLPTDTVASLGLNIDEGALYGGIYGQQQNVDNTGNTTYTDVGDSDFDGLEALAAETRLSAIAEGEEYGAEAAAAATVGETINPPRRRSSAATNGASIMALHPASKVVAQAAISMDAAHAAGAPRDLSEEALSTPVDDVHVHTPRELSVYYRQACRARDERPIDSVLKQLKRANERGQNLHTLSLSGVLLDRRTADALADMLALRSGLRRLELEDCSLVNDALKSILHSLLLVDELQELSLARNRRISSDGFKYIAIYARKAKQLRSLDLSGCRPDKRGCKYLSHALASSSVMMLRSALRVLRMDDCGLRSAFLEVLIPSIRRSNVVDLSMTDNHFGPNGGIWIAALLDADWIPSEETNGLFAGIESRVERLHLSHNEIRSGIEQISVALRRNRVLRELNLAHNDLNTRALTSLAMSLTENHALQTLDLSGNPVSGPVVDGAIALAEFLPETQTLRRLDLSENPEIDIAGVMALSVSVRMNRSLQYLDVNVMPDDTEMASLSRDILLTCIRNTQLQEEAQRRQRKATTPHASSVQANPDAANATAVATSPESAAAASSPLLPPPRGSSRPGVRTGVAAT
ncbi:hypothetical protein THASP1DRAFT_28646 [Thamnocephalis sphaerospora]|uniref:RNI-like protein n=1 Tax=Thamnocephalis sphaerospora TaxID=78915 RepID=A0A4P9XVE6_9FUNG|nr:hypothetical protein THASP1DRAFT_28646 [Thamnocephalis sphaerospora]|eukprot:RKP09571.1 hypothetical protein THASP1DRAFT_28646 [Thamnocephalis sphaerospora]